MVRTGGRAAVLQQLLIDTGLRSALSPPRPQISDLPEMIRSELVSLYRALGGTEAPPTLRPGPWDLSFDDGLVVELDEELHFNRYRQTTLDSSWSNDLPWTAGYRSLCRLHEAECRSAGSWGKRWTNTSCEQMFGPPGAAGDLNGAGAPRWKQRALYDALKDLGPTAVDGLRLCRLSVYDRVQGSTLGAVLEGRKRADLAEVAALFRDRIAGDGAG